jgi:hypothetical protein
MHKRSGADEWIWQMPESRTENERKASSHHSLRMAFMVYGIIVVGLLGFFILFPDMKARGTQGGGTPIQTAAKAIRYEAVIANWNRYRAKDARAEAR